MILFINTADGEKIDLALVLGGKILAQKSFKAKYKQSEMLLPQIQNLLKLTKRKINSLKAILVVIGPGPFSAIRIGLATANALAYALNLPIAGIKLTELNKNKDFASFIVQKANKAKFNTIIKPFYGAEPNITLKKK